MPSKCVHQMHNNVISASVVYLFTSDTKADVTCWRREV